MVRDSANGAGLRAVIDEFLNNQDVSKRYR
jgi:hypothetical protein